MRLEVINDIEDWFSEILSSQLQSKSLVLWISENSVGYS